MAKATHPLDAPDSLTAPDEPIIAGVPRNVFMLGAGVGQATVSHHLKVLREAGLVEVERRGIWAHYRIAPDAESWLRAIL